MINICILICGVRKKYIVKFDFSATVSFLTVNCLFLLFIFPSAPLLKCVYMGICHSYVHIPLLGKHFSYSSVTMRREEVGLSQFMLHLTEEADTETWKV